MLHFEHSFALCWNLDLHRIDQKYSESFEIWCWRMLEKIILTDVKN
jgi:hypothetical protein